MEQKQITLKEIYVLIKKMQQELHTINERLSRESEFTEEENKEFIEGTRQAWKDFDEGKYISYESPEEFLSTFKKNAQNKRNR